jgi:prepilin-type N-terminal cleavage/methylation domain-containing protein
MSPKKNKNMEKGFSIIEVVVAIGIISISFVVLMSLFAFNMRMEIQSRDKVVASYLAQEAIEVIRQTRDNNWDTSPNLWDQGITADDPGVGAIGSTRYAIVYKTDLNDTAQAWSVADSSETDPNRKIYMTPAGNYTQTGGIVDPAWKSTSFARVIKIEKETDHDLKLTVDVQYNGLQKAEVISYIYEGWH